LKFGDRHRFYACTAESSFDVLGKALGTGRPHVLYFTLDLYNARGVGT
jgi:hypothetical protein